MNNNQTIVVVLLVILLVAAGGYLFYNYNRDDVTYNPSNETVPQVNNGNNNADEEDEWLLAVHPEFSFRYPADSGSDYVEYTDWPAEIRLTEEAYTCTEAGAETDRAGRTEAVTIGGEEFCRTVITEGAAGSTFRQYAYAFAHAEGTAILTFSVRMPQCENYDGSERTACTGQQEEFDADTLVGQMMDTFTVVPV
jgi:hypothetical protein